MTAPRQISVLTRAENGSTELMVRPSQGIEFANRSFNWPRSGVDPDLDNSFGSDSELSRVRINLDLLGLQPLASSCRRTR